MKTIVCYGDSNTYGFNPETEGRFSAENRWPQVLAHLLGKDYSVIAEGLPGRTTVFCDPLQEGLSGLECLSPILRSHCPIDMLIVMLGTNDTKERFGASSAVIALGLERLLEKALSLPVWNGTPSILVVSPVAIEPAYETAAFGTTMGKGCCEKSQDLAALYQEIAQRMGLNFYDAGSVAAVHPKDYMHLTAQGQVALAEGIAQVVKEVL